MQANMTTPSMHDHYIFRFDTLEKKVDKTNESIEKLVNVVLIGNGKPALTTRIESMERGCAECKLAKQHVAKDRKAMWAAIGGVALVFFFPKIWLGVKAIIAFL